MISSLQGCSLQVLCKARVRSAASGDLQVRMKCPGDLATGGVISIIVVNVIVLSSLKVCSLEIIVSLL